MESPYKNLPKEKWMEKTRELVDNHPLKDKIKDVVLKSWNDIFNSKIGSFSIGKEIFPSPQILSFFLHELVAHYLSLMYPNRYKVGELKGEKDVHDMVDPSMASRLKHRLMRPRYLQTEVMRNLRLNLKQRIRTVIILLLISRRLVNLILILRF